ncbi:MAG: ATP-dependent protease ATPase subunit HslU [Planctomycetota bacterium]|nr:ATP-dependent protease ATPase subunit HslU [Planctomycetota bacterium]
MNRSAEKDLTPARIVEALDRHVVGQREAKRAVAVAIRSRWRRMQLGADLRDEVVPKNILLIGPTGVGKTEIARRIAALIDAPFIKVEATKFTEVGYVGRDVDSIVRDLVENAITLVREGARVKVRTKAREAAEERVLSYLVTSWQPGDSEVELFTNGPEGRPTMQDLAALRVKLRERLRAGALSERPVDVEVASGGQALGNIFGDQAFAQTGMDFGKIFEQLQKGRGSGAPTKTRRMSVKDAVEALTEEEAEKLVDDQNVATEAIELVENSAIVFLDEIDKVAGRQAGSGPDVSREGVQRDLLPLIEGTTVTTRHGPVKTDHILFIGAGAFHVSKPSDLLPELQGRMPIRVRLNALTEQDFVRILTEPRGALTRQYEALMGTEGVRLAFTEDGVAEIARVAAAANLAHENIGARRLFTVLERVVDEVSFAGPDLRGQTISIDRAYVRARVGDLLDDQDLGRYVL